MSSYTSPQQSSAVTIKPEDLEESGSFTVDLGFPVSSCVSTVIYKVSNSDDEDAVTQSDRQAFGTPTRSTARIPSFSHPVANHALQDFGRPMAANNFQAANLGPRRSTATRLNALPRHRPPYMVAEHDQRGRSPSIGNRFHPAQLAILQRSSRMHSEAVSRSQRSLMRPPDLPVAYHGPRSRIALSRADFTAILSSAPRQHANRQGQNETLAGSRDQMMREPTQAGPNRPFANPATSYTINQGDHRPTSRDAFNHIPEVPRGLKQRYAHVLPPTSSKHTGAHPRSLAAVRVKYSKHSPDEISLRYKTIKVIKMPARTDLIPGQITPEPTPNNLPYGDTEDYQSCMLIYWLDEQEFTYSESFELFKKRFPRETAGYQSFCLRHKRALQRLAKKYGLKPENEIRKPGDNVLRRGRQTSNK